MMFNSGGFLSLPRAHDERLSMLWGRHTEGAGSEISLESTHRRTDRCPDVPGCHRHEQCLNRVKQT